MLKYLVVWAVAATALLVPSLAVFLQEKWAVSLALGIILFLPLARIGLAPLALEYGRHR